MKLVLVLIVVGLAGCAARAQVLSSNERSVIVQAGSARPDMAQEAADAECKKHGRFARLSLKPSPLQYAFDCIN